MHVGVNINKIVSVLHDKGFVTEVDGSLQLSRLGSYAIHFKEVHCLVFADLMISRQLHALNAIELVGVLSCFTNISVPTDNRRNSPATESSVCGIVNVIRDMYDANYDIEVKNNICTGVDYSMHFELILETMLWCKCESAVECKQLLGEMSCIFVGEFIKAILKINNIVAEMINAAEWGDDLEFAATLHQIPKLTLKFVAENQSLYV